MRFENWRSELSPELAADRLVALLDDYEDACQQADRPGVLRQPVVCF